MQMAASQAQAQMNANAIAIALTTASRPLPRWLRPDPKQPDTMGWRAWVWHPGIKMLVSPHQYTPWTVDRLIAERWSDEDALRGAAGIHARLVPKHWKIIGWPDDESSSGLDDKPELVTGIVERFGRYVLGTEGWRAEQVVIRELMAPSTEIGLALEQRYPDVIVHYPDQIEEGETPCKSVKSSALEKGSRSLPPPAQPAPTQPFPQMIPIPQRVPRKNPVWLVPASLFEKAYQPEESRLSIGFWGLGLIGLGAGFALMIFTAPL
jgi:hypothetical protein